MGGGIHQFESGHYAVAHESQVSFALQHSLSPASDLQYLRVNFGQLRPGLACGVDELTAWLIC